MLTQERLKERLYYDPMTGLFTWLIPKARWLSVGAIAGYKMQTGYIQIGIDGRYYSAHRLACFYMKGYWPKQMDHEDHIRHNNKWDNLREATCTQNSRNSSLRVDNKTGIAGVKWDKRTKKWKARIGANRKLITIGYFVDKFEAICARKSAEFKYGYHANHGMKKW